MTESAPAATRRHEFTVTRTFNAPRELVFRAWTEPAQFARWWGGADATVPLETTRIDLRVGGGWSAIMSSGGEEHPFSGIYQEIDPPGRLVMTLTDEAQPNPDRQHIVTVTLTESEGRTTMMFSQAGDFGDAAEEMKQGLAGGYAAFFDALAAVVEAK